MLAEEMVERITFERIDALHQTHAPLRDQTSGTTMETDMKDLDGTFVISIEHAVAAPYASCKLADAGARVVKVERPEGDFARNYDDYVKGQSAYFVWLNRGKESIALNLKSDAEKAVLSAMLEKADVLIQNLAPGTLAKLGFAPEALREKHPRLIICSISGYGEEGPWKDQKAYDLLIQAESGLCAINGAPEAPGRVGVSVCDIAAGMTAYQSILQALLGRQKTGEGRIIDVSLFHAMADWMNVPYLQHRYGKKEITRQGLRHPTIAPYGAFICADEKAILISIQNDREWVRLCRDVLGRADLATDARYASNALRIANREIVDTACAEFFASLSRDDCAAKLDAADIAYGRLSDLDDLADHPQARFAEVEIPSGNIELLAPGARIVGQEDQLGPVPTINEHGDALRTEFKPD